MYADTALNPERGIPYCTRLAIGQINFDFVVHCFGCMQEQFLQSSLKMALKVKFAAFTFRSTQYHCWGSARLSGRIRLVDPPRGITADGSFISDNATRIQGAG